MSWTLSPTLVDRAIVGRAIEVRLSGVRCRWQEGCHFKQVPLLSLCRSVSRLTFLLWSGHPVLFITGSFRRRFIRSLTPSLLSHYCACIQGERLLHLIIYHTGNGSRLKLILSPETWVPLHSAGLLSHHSLWLLWWLLFVERELQLSFHHYRIRKEVWTASFISFSSKLNGNHRYGLIISPVVIIDIDWLYHQ